MSKKLVARRKIRCLLRGLLTFSPSTKNRYWRRCFFVLVRFTTFHRVVFQKGTERGRKSIMSSISQLQLVYLLNCKNCILRNLSVFEATIEIFIDFTLIFYRESNFSRCENCVYTMVIFFSFLHWLSLLIIIIFFFLMNQVITDVSKQKQYKVNKFDFTFFRTIVALIVANINNIYIRDTYLNNFQLSRIIIHLKKNP